MHPTSIQVTEGSVDFTIPSISTTCNTWYKIVGSLSSGIRPLVVVHGGPGLSHDYMLPLSDLATLYSIPVIFYDQIGNGLSTHLPDKKGDDSFWTLSLFIHELDNLISALGITSYDLCGQSWGGVISSVFAARKPSPKGLTKLVLSNTPASAEGWTNAYRRYMEELPNEAREALYKPDTPERAEAMSTFTRRHVCTVHPMPEELVASFAWIEKDDTVFLTMLPFPPPCFP